MVHGCSYVSFDTINITCAVETTFLCSLTLFVSFLGTYSAVELFVASNSSKYSSYLLIIYLTPLDVESFHKIPSPEET